MKSWVYLGVKTCEVFLCFVTIIFVLSFVLTSLFSLFYVTRESDRFLHQGWAEILSWIIHILSNRSRVKIFKFTQKLEVWITAKSEFKLPVITIWQRFFLNAAFRHISSLGGYRKNILEARFALGWAHYRNDKHVCQNVYVMYLHTNAVLYKWNFSYQMLKRIWR